jgi:hypothetical protein
VNPYLQAFDAYHSDGPPCVPWPDVLDFHFQGGVILNTPTLFLVARPIPIGAPLTDHPRLIRWPETSRLWTAGTAWHIWTAAGNLREMLELPIVRALPPDTPITFQRGARSARIHRHQLRHLFSRV